MLESKAGTLWEMCEGLDAFTSPVVFVTVGPPFMPGCVTPGFWEFDQ